MDAESGKLTVFFEGPFWVGAFERRSCGKLSVRKVTFGAEPKGDKVWNFILKRYNERRFSPAIEAEMRQTADNPKHRQRSAKERRRTFGVGTKSPQALQMQREERKTRRKRISKEQQESEKQRRLALKSKSEK